MTTLRTASDVKSGRVRRIYVRRSGLRGKVWFEESRYHHGMCEVRHEGDCGETGDSGEAAHIAEARAALADMGLDMARCSWNDIVELANAPPSHWQRVSRFLIRRLSFRRHRQAG
jgi:hypothetical protein